MSPSGPRYPTSASSQSGSNGAWTNPTNVFASDGVYATGNISGGGSSTNNLLTSGYGFSIPSTAIIDGIYVEFQRYGSSAATKNIQMIKAGTLVGTLVTGDDIWPVGTEAWWFYGGAGTLFGTTWTPSDINNSGFGVAISAYNTAGGGSANIDAVRITVYWHTSPVINAKRYLYKVFSNNGTPLGNLPTPSSDFSFEQDINTGGAQITIVVPMSVDTSFQAVDNLTDESGNQLTDESSNNLTDEGQIPIVAPGESGTQALIKNGNRIQVWESGYWNPNGKIMFSGMIENWQATFGGEDQDDSITLLVYSDGQDLDQYPIRGYPYTYTSDVTQTSDNTTGTITQNSFSFTFFGQTWKVGAGVTNLGAISLLLQGTANVTITVYNGVSGTFPIGSMVQAVDEVNPTEVQFAFPTEISTTPGSTLFFTVECFVGQSINIYYQNTNVYASGSAYQAIFTGTSGGSFLPITGDLYFKTFSGTGSTTATFTNLDPGGSILPAIIDDYNGRGGLITLAANNSADYMVTTEFNTATVYEGLQTLLTLCPDGFYFYVDLGLDELIFKQLNDGEVDVVFTKGYHIDSLKLSATIEQTVNTVLFTGGLVSGNNIYVIDSDVPSVALYGPRLDRASNNSVIDTGTATTVAEAEIAERKDEQYQTTVTILDTKMDISTLKPGMVCGFNGFGTFVDTINAQIVRVAYTPEQATLTLGILPKRLVPDVERVTRNLLALNTVDNPTSPS
jgi:hypothetical protein